MCVEVELADRVGVWYNTVLRGDPPSDLIDHLISLPTVLESFHTRVTSKSMFSFQAISIHIPLKRIFPMLRLVTLALHSKISLHYDSMCREAKKSWLRMLRMLSTASMSHIIRQLNPEWHIFSRYLASAPLCTGDMNPISVGYSTHIKDGSVVSVDASLAAGFDASTVIGCFVNVGAGMKNGSLLSILLLLLPVNDDLFSASTSDTACSDVCSHVGYTVFILSDTASRGPKEKGGTLIHRGMLDCIDRQGRGAFSRLAQSRTTSP